MLPDTDRKGTLKVAEKIRTRIREYDFLLKDRSYGPITISIGGTVFPEDAKNVDDLLKVADDNLYLAKKGGRDRVVVHGGAAQNV